MEEKNNVNEEFKKNISDKFHAVKEKVSDAVLKEDGSLDTDKIGNTVIDTAQKALDSVQEGYRKFRDEYVKDGQPDKEKLGDAAKRTYRKAGRTLAAGVSRLADYLTDKFGVQGQSGEIVDSRLVTAEPEDFVTEE